MTARVAAPSARPATRARERVATRSSSASPRPAAQTREMVAAPSTRPAAQARERVAARSSSASPRPAAQTSETVALKNFLIDLPVIVVDLQRAIEATVGTADAQSVLVSKRRAWLRRITQFKFVAVCLLLLDINIISRRFSKGTQADDGVVVDLPLLYDSYRTSIAQLAAGSFGPKVQNNLANLRNGKYGSITLQQALGSTRRAANARPPSGTDEAPASSPAGDDQRLLEELSLELSEAPEESIWIVEEILDHAPAGRGVKFLVWWHGYPKHEATWEPRRHLQPVDVAEYFSSLEAAPGALPLNTP
jgi:hypothetical protein